MIPIDLACKTAIVTGGTRGIGRAISRRLAEAGANTLCVYRTNTDEAQLSLAERTAAGSASKHLNLQADIADPAAGFELLAQLRDNFGGRADFLVLNAGVGLSASVRDAASADWQRMFETNLFSAFRLCHDLIPVLRPGGSIVAIGSGSGHDPIPGLAFYGASKAALNMFIADLAFEVGPLGLRANVVSPGSTDAQNQAPAPPPGTPPATGSSNALGRRGVPDDIAQAVLFFCSDLSGFVTGQALRVNGGPA